MKVDARMLAKLAHWINERESIRVKKESNVPKPWTKDVILQNYRFCNVHREDDYVTRWLKANWRDPHFEDPHLWHAMLIARFINWPETLTQIDWPEPWPEKKAQVRKAMLSRRAKGHKVFTGAYIVSTNGIATDKISYVLGTFDRAWKMLPNGLQGCTQLEQAHKLLLAIDGMGPFMSAQVLADLKHTPAMRDATDWWDWCSPGPGSVRGMARLCGEVVKNRALFITYAKEIRSRVQPAIGDIKLDLQDMQNCFCEFEKYIRGYSRSTYPGA